MTTGQRAELARLEQSRFEAWQVYCVVRDRYDRARRELFRQIDQDNKEQREREQEAA